MSDTPLHEDVSTDTAWVVGRRIYVRCPKASTLDNGLIALGAKWDWDLRARWTGTGKRDQVRALLLADLEEARAEEQASLEILAAARWVPVPAELGASLHSQAGALGAVWDGEGSRYALPSDESQAELQRIVDAKTAEHTAHKERIAAEVAEKHAETAAEQQRVAEERRRAAAAETENRRAQALAATGRTATGETAQVHTISTRRMNRATAESSAFTVGSVRQVDIGRRGVIVDRRIWFTSEEDACDLDWHPEAPDEAHWNIQYTLHIVEPTADERRADAEAAAEHADAIAIRDLFDSLHRLDRNEENASPVPDAARLGTIRGSAGTAGSASFAIGTVILTRDGTVVWQHPGHYDDWHATNATTTDPSLVAAVRRLLDAGTRTREYDNQLTYTYEVTSQPQ